MGGANSVLDEEDLVEITASDFTPRNRRATKHREQIDDRFLRHSKRNVVKLAGSKAAPATPQEKEVLSPTPLAVILAPGNPIAPHLTEDIV
jgi:hypothetical protein